MTPPAATRHAPTYAAEAEAEPADPRRAGWERRRAARVEDAEFLAGVGVRMVEAAARLGTTRDALTRALYRAGRPDLIAHLTRPTH